MPPSPPNLVFNKDEWLNQSVTFRVGYVIIRADTRGRSDTDIENTINAALDAVVRPAEIKYRNGGWAYVKVDDYVDIPDVAQKLAQQTGVVYAEPDLAMVAAKDTDDPLIDPGVTDPYGAPLQQWAIDLLDMQSVWDITTGDESVLVGLIDSGLPLVEGCEESITKASRLTDCVDHEDLDGSRFLSGNNYLYDPPVPVPHDSLGHGTNMAGIIAAQEDNGTGLAGLNWQSLVYICRVLDDDNKTTDGLVYMAITEVMDYAKSVGKQVVINLSMTFLDEVFGLDIGTFDDYCGKLVADGGLMVCAAGNNDDTVQFPAAAAYRYPGNVVAVGATSSDDTMWSLSNYGDTVVLDGGDSIDLAITVVAPGNDIATTDIALDYEAESGTSEATAHVTGLISLMWSFNPDMSAAQIIDCLKRTASIPESILSSWSQADLAEKWYGHGRINAVRAVAGVDWDVTLETTAISFVDIPEGDEPSETIKVEVAGCADVTFTVTVSGDDFGVVPGTYNHNPEDGTIWERLVATYASTLPDDAEGVVTIQWDDKPGEPPMEVTISANRVAAGNPVIVITADKSGSMALPSGIMEYTRMDVLNYSTGILVDLMEPGGAGGLVSFDEEAQHPVDVTVIDPGDPDTTRDLLKDAVGALEAGGYTSIGAGLLQAKTDLDTVPADLVAGTEKRAIIVLTDGKENREPLVGDILTEDFTYPVYAIGMGDPGTLVPDDLIALCNTTLGHSTVTGALDDDSEYDVAKYYSQILAEINGDSVVEDPVQRLRPGAQDFKIAVTRADSRLDVILMRQAEAPFEVQLITPAGEPLPIDDVSLMQGTRVDRYRVDLPVRTTLGALHAGTWRVRVGMRRDAFSSFLAQLENDGVDVSTARAHGLRYSLQSNVRSNLRMFARIYQGGYEPGSSMFIRARLTQNDLPMADSVAQVRAVVRHPDGASDEVKLLPSANGLFEADYLMRMPGVYKALIIAAGRSRRGDKFRREVLLTGVVWS